MRRGIRTKRWPPMVVAALALALVAGACGKTTPTGGGTTGPSVAPVKIGLVYDLIGRGDKSFNDAAYAGLSRAEKDFKLSVKELTPNQAGTNRDELLNLLATQKYGLIIGVGFLFAPSLCAAMLRYPDIKFAGVDAFVDHTTCKGAKDLTTQSNYSALLFAENEGSYLVGAAAALKSKTHHIGFIGGVYTPLIQKFQAGYVAGAKKIDPTIKVDIKYISQPPDYSGFNDPAKAQVIATSMYQGGADVVYHAAGGSGLGLFKAAQAYSTANNTHVWAIGVDSDQYQQMKASAPQLAAYILTSMLKRVDVAVYDTIKSYVNGTFTGGVQTFDLKVNGVGYSTSGGFVNDIKAQLDSLKQQIISGQITVPTTPTS